MENTTMTTQTWQLDPAHTSIDFAVRHLMISTVRGRFGGISGTIGVDENDLRTAKVDITIDVASIDTRQEQRDAHLRSPDFFDAARFPTARFVSRRIEGDASGDFQIIGDLTIRDVTKEITVGVTNEGQGVDPWGNLRSGFSATAKIDRREFGLTWNQALETGGVVVGNDIKLSIDAEFFRAAEVEAKVAA
jgi:polyisoprenoid-binding protein YceI